MTVLSAGIPPEIEIHYAAVYAISSYIQTFYCAYLFMSLTMSLFKYSTSYGPTVAVK